MHGSKLFLSVLLLLPTAVEAAPEHTAVVTAIRADGERRQGAAVAVGARGRVLLTAAHVVEDSKAVVITAPDGRRMNARQGERHPVLDVAVLMLQEPLASPTRPRLSYGVPPRNGDPVEVIGTVYGPYVDLSDGACVRRFAGGFTIDAWVEAGASGSGVYDRSGRLLGIVVSGTLGRTDRTQVVSLAPLQNWIRRIVRSNSAPIGPTSRP